MNMKNIILTSILLAGCGCGKKSVAMQNPNQPNQPGMPAQPRAPYLRNQNQPIRRPLSQQEQQQVEQEMPQQPAAPRYNGPAFR